MATTSKGLPLPPDNVLIEEFPATLRDQSNVVNGVLVSQETAITAAKNSAAQSAASSKASSLLVGAPAGSAVLAAISEGGAARSELNAAIGESVTDGTAYLDAFARNSGPISFEQFPVPASGLEQFNTAAIAQDTITTAPNGNIYAVYWDSNRQPVIAVRSPSVGIWTTASLADVPGNPLKGPVDLDSHNNIVVAVDGDGYIHVAGNHHSGNWGIFHPLRYIRSTRPNDITSWEALSMVGAEENRVTYPQFVKTGNDLLFFYRHGLSGSGDHFVNKYITATKTWTRVVQLFNGTSSSPDVCAYINRVARNPQTGRLHIFYMWRTDLNVSSNFDLSYVYSDDNGATWRNATGTAQTLPITKDNTAPRIIAGNPGRLTNQSGASVDSNGVAHTLFWLGADGSMRSLHHFYWGGSAWVNEVVAVETITGVSRPTAYSTSDGKTYALYKRDGKPVALRIAPTLGTEVILFNHNQAAWEPTYDANAPANTLRIMIAPAYEANAAFFSTYAGVLAVDMTKVDNLPPNRIVTAPRNMTAQPQAPGVPGYLMEPGCWYGPAGSRLSTLGALGALTEGTFRGSYVTAEKPGKIASAACNVIEAGAAGLTAKLLVISLGHDRQLGDYVVVATTPNFDVSSTGIKEASFTAPYLMRKNETVIVGVLITGSGAGAKFLSLSGTHDVRIPGGSASSIMTNHLVGLSQSGVLASPITVPGLFATATVPYITIKAGS